ncbi:MAG TPA: hypothetical protein DIC34_20405 [Treponema sp.]|nr:MAG: hypothetical protein A2001_16445 [Treponema sp. GWC1_61_84]OHE75782.1 MAG: hypothetical protein A2413_06165 [Treponema sp. RIFOXYC1_FULL_61_9]HCM28866.1 hypothetical protein [Treponema sp.]
MAMRSVPLFEAKNRLTALVHEVEKGSPIQLTRHGKAVAVLMGSADYATLDDKGQSFSARLDRFRLEWPQDESPEWEDPFSGIRSDQDGRRVDL